MKLHSIRVEQLRRFRQPFELGGLAAGINVICGPNGAGKSTLVRAIRAAFLERHRSSSVDDLRPEGDASAAPTVELAFDLGGTDCTLSKSFLTRKRCRLRMGNVDLDGDEAEQKLADLLGFEVPGRGASKEEHWGIPGLLWIEQGCGQQINPAVGHAADHLRSALDSSLGEVASSGGDELLDQIQAQRRQLLTPTGRPSGDYAEALKRRGELDVELRELQTTIDHYRREVDTLTTLLAAHRRDEAEQPWLDLREQVREARERLEIIHQRRQQLETEQRQLAATTAHLTLLRDQLATFAGLGPKRERCEALLRTTTESVARTQSVLEQLAARKTAADAAYQAAREAQRGARVTDRRQALERQTTLARTELARLQTAVSEAEASQQRLAELRLQARQRPVTRAELDQLRQQANDLRELTIRSEAVATRLRYRLDEDRRLQLGDAALSGSGEQLVLVPTTLVLPGLGQIDIIPGGEDVAELARRQDEATERHQAMLARLGFGSVEAAETRFAELARVVTDIRAVEDALRVHAPAGVPQLQSQRDALQQELAIAESELSELPPTPATVASLASADAEVDAASEMLRQVAEELTAAQLVAGRQQAERDTAQRELAAVDAELQSPERRHRERELQIELASLQADQARREREMAAHRLAIEAEQPQLLEQDIHRFETSASQLERAHAERKQKLAELQGQLKQAGAQGLEEQQAELQGQFERAERRCGELERRAAALELLAGLLQEKRRELTRRMQAPLQRHLNHYLQLLFPNASVDINEDLTLGRISRPLTTGVDNASLDQQSFGTREQLCLIGRLAYADLLKEAGRPTLIILDDALVHSDEQRLGQMKRILYDAAQRHQILLFSCHPAAWRDLGVAQRVLPA